MKKVKNKTVLENISKLTAVISFVIFGFVGVLFLSSSFAAPKNNTSSTVVNTYVSSTQRLSVGQTVDAQLRVNSLTNVINAVQANIKYDTRYFDFISVDNTGSLLDIVAQTDSSSPGTVRVARASLNGVSGNQLIATVKLKAKAPTRKTSITYVDGTQVYSKDTVSNILQATYGYNYTIR